MNIPETLLSRPLAELIDTELLCVYEGWSIERLGDFFNRHGIHYAPVIAADHQLVGGVSNGDIHRFLHSDETLRARAVNQHYRRLTGSDLDDPVELTRWTRRAQHYCTVHQIMSSTVPSLPEHSPLREALALLAAGPTDVVFVTRGEILVGQMNSQQVLTMVVGAAS